MELQIKADLTQTLGVRQMHELMEVYIKTDKKYECIFIDKDQAKQVIAKLQEFVGKKVKTSTKSVVCPKCGCNKITGDGSKSWCMNEQCDFIEAN